jgi:hypothetical protein
MRQHLVQFANAIGLTDQAALFADGSLVRPPLLGNVAPRCLRGESFIAFDSGRRGIDAITASGAPITRCRRHYSAAPNAIGRSWSRVTSYPGASAWIDDAGCVEVHSPGLCVLRSSFAAGERAIETAMLGGTVAVRLDDGQFRVLQIGPARPACPIAHFQAAHPSVRAVAGNAWSIGLVDAGGRPHFFGIDCALLSKVPAGLPPLASIAIAPCLRAAALDDDGRIHDWGPAAVGRTQLPAELSGPDFVSVRVGIDWIAAVDRCNRAIGFGHGMAAWDRIDPLEQMLLAARGFKWFA